MKTVIFFISSTRHSCKQRIDGIWRFAKDAGWHVQVVERAFNPVDVARIIGFWKPVGIIAECANGADELNAKNFGKIPVVYFDEAFGAKGRGFYIRLDCVGAVTAAVGELVHGGYVNFAYVGFRLPVYWSKDRGQNFRACVVQAKGTYVGGFEHDRPLSDIERKEALAEFLSGLPRPCGVFAANDQVSDEVVTVAKSLGLRIPDDIGIVGVDDDVAICETSNPTLTSVHPDFEGGGYRAAELLAAKMANPNMKPVQETYRVLGVVRRESTHIPQKSNLDADVAAAIHFIKASSGAHIGVPDVVKLMGCSRRKAETLFRETTGKSILETINDVLFESACNLLVQGSAPVSVIADRLGVSRGTLDGLFLVRKGVSANVWRKSCNR